MHIARDLRILFGYAVLGVDDDQGHVAAAHRGQRAHDAVAFDGFFLNGALAANTGRVDDVVALAVANKRGINRVARCARNAGNHGALLPENPIHKAGFAHVRAADDGDLNGVLLFVLGLLILREMLDHFIQQIAQTEHVGRGDGEGITQTERVEIVDVVVHALIIDLVDYQNDRLAALAQHGGDVFVVSGHAGAAVGKKENHIAGVDGDFSLTTHLLEQDIVRARLDAAGVDQGEFVVEPFAIRIDAVARHAGGILHDRDAPPRDFVKKGRFAHVRAADDRDKGFGHAYSSVPRRA